MYLVIQGIKTRAMIKLFPLSKLQERERENMDGYKIFTPHTVDRV